MAENDDNKGPVKASPGGRPAETFSTNNWNGRVANDSRINENRKRFQDSKNTPSPKESEKKSE